MQKIVDHDRAFEQIRFKLEEAQASEPDMLNRETGLRNDAILKVHIVDSINLKQSSQFTCVELTQD